MQRRGFLQLIGTAAALSAVSAPTPLFTLGGPPTTPQFEGHLIADVARVIGRYTRVGDEGLMVRSGMNGGDTIAVPDCGGLHTIADVIVPSGDQPLLAFYQEAYRMRDRIKGELVRSLAKLNRNSGAPYLGTGPVPAQVVTLMDSPIYGIVKENGTVQVVCSYCNYIVWGEVKPRNTWSTHGQVPISEKLDIEHLVYIDKQVREGLIILT